MTDQSIDDRDSRADLVAAFDDLRSRLARAAKSPDPVTHELAASIAAEAAGHLRKLADRIVVDRDRDRARAHARTGTQVPEEVT